MASPVCRFHLCTGSRAIGEAAPQPPFNSVPDDLCPHLPFTQVIFMMAERPSTGWNGPLGSGLHSWLPGYVSPCLSFQGGGKPRSHGGRRCCCTVAHNILAGTDNKYPQVCASPLA